MLNWDCYGHNSIKLQCTKKKYFPVMHKNVYTFFQSVQVKIELGHRASQRENPSRPVSEASKISLWLVKIPKLEVRLACAFFVREIGKYFASAVESFVKLPFQLFFK
jgi:hypothetical protein